MRTGPRRESKKTKQKPKVQVGNREVDPRRHRVLKASEGDAGTLEAAANELCNISTEELWNTEEIRNTEELGNRNTRRVHLDTFVRELRNMRQISSATARAFAFPFKAERNLTPPTMTRRDPGISVPCSFLHLKHRHLSSIWLAPRSQQRRQLNDLPSQVKPLNLSTPGGSSNNNLLVFPGLIPDYFQ
ncbi:hypothetical protein AMECASPLE_010722 [Ameca splendens]|uniref:Uncharacterized protein n=1 Tax=Ameca splendens TaxID=208324 RepID=A0ABV0YYU5_9TELE